MSKYKIPLPNYTQAPNVIYDEWMSKLKHAELLVLLAVCRKTFGYHKTKDQISISQLMEITGLSKSSVINSGKSLQKKNLIKKVIKGPNGRQATTFQIIFTGTNFAPPPGIKFIPTKEKSINKDIIQPLTPSKTKVPKVAKEVVVKNFLEKKEKEWIKEERDKSLIKEALEIFKNTPVETISNKNNYLEGIYKKIVAKKKEAIDVIGLNKKWIESYYRHREAIGAMGILKHNHHKAWDQNSNITWFYEDKNFQKKIKKFYNNYR